LGLRASRDLLIHLVRALPEPEVHGARVLGVDEFSVRRGPEYATVLVDAESHRPIDVLDERSADQFAAWLQQHTPAEIICRDRAGCYADGATRGAPRAVQVADRYHMLANLADALERVAHQHARCWTTDPLALAPPISPPAAPAPQAETRIARRLRERFEQVHALRDRGLTITVIPRTLHLDRHPVRKFARASGTGSFPRSQPRAPSSRLLARFVAYLQRRWREGGEDGVLLLQELQRQGYRGSLRTLQRYLHTLRGATPVREPRLVVSARSVVSLILRPVAALAPHEARLLEHLCACCSDLASSCRLARACLSIVRERRGGVALRTWLEEAATSKVAALARFAAGLRQDEAAITAGVTLPWNSGVVEGHNTRIKLIKRMMYGRGLFDLLRRRVLLAR
jgi:hypothetical protein